MSIDQIPMVDYSAIPQSLRTHIEFLEAKGIDTRFHRYIAHSTAATDFYWKDFYTNLFYKGTLSLRTKEIVRLVLATVSGCPFCRQNDIDSARKNGVSEQEVNAILALNFEELPSADAAAAAIAQRISPFCDGETLTDTEWAELRRQFTDEEIAELLICTSVLAGVGRMLAVTGFIPRTCPMPG